MNSVLVLYGGISDEREVSMQSGQAVINALRTCGYDVASYDPATGMDGLQKAIKSADVVFPALHGKGGEDGEIQELLEKLGKPFVGPGSQASKLCFDKWEYKQHLLAHNYPCPKGALVDKSQIWEHELTKQAFVLKPATGGSSIDTFIVRDPSTIDKEAIEKTLDRYGHMLLEELISGTETTVAVLGDKALPMIEIVPPSNQEFDYENKYNGKTQELCPPLHISADLQKQAQELAVSVHRSTGCVGMSRTDIIITPSGHLYILETNTIPGLTDQSLLPKAALAAGIDMPKLVKMLVEDAIKRAA